MSRNMAATPASGKCESACRNSRTSPDAAQAPAFICAARPGRAAKARSASGEASARVASVLPPSTTITSCPAARSGCSATSEATMRRASLRAGMTIETRTGWARTGGTDGIRGGQASAPPQLEPWPAVQP